LSGGGGFGRTPPETIGNRKTEFNRIFLCTSKSEAAVTSNEKTALYCMYVEANY